MAALRRRWFQAPWEFRESFVFAAAAVLAGFLVEYATGGTGIVKPRLPYNAVVLSLFGVLVTSAGLAFRNNAFVKWLGGIPLGLALISAISVLSLLGGIIPQGEPRAGTLLTLLRIDQIFSSWTFAVAVILFLVNLGLSLSWKLAPFSWKNIQFILFHAGFWLALGCGVIGSSDLQRFVVPVEVGKANNLGYVMESEIPQKLPFSVHLKEFSLEEYPPQLMLFDPKTEKIVTESSQAVNQVRKGATASWKGIEVQVLDIISYAIPGKDGIPIPADRNSGTTFAKVRIKKGNVTQEAWLSTGSPMLKPYAAELGNLVLIMVPGTPKAFRSAVTILDENGQSTEATLAVNHPVDVNGWKFYQMGYDEKSGRWSQLSLVEVIRDPWLPAVYLGLFMIMAGNLLFFWNGIKQREAA
ncbi:MAG: cytochrome c biogenesis protein ResB [Chlorobiaceae bacterium]